jgi:hypothetical protein
VTALVVAAMAMFAVVYGSPASASSKQPPEGPLSGIVTAASIGATGAPVGEAVTFSPDTNQIVAIVPIGKIGHSENLDVVWSSLNAAGSPTVLLRQRIRVTSFTVAYSTATVTGTLAVGNYEVNAVLGSRHTSADWNVAATPALPSPTSALQPPGLGVDTPLGSVGLASPTNIDAVLDAASAGPLTPGPDGTVNPLPTPPPPSGTTPNQNGTCQDMDVEAAWEPLFNVLAGAIAEDCDSPITLSAAENDAPLAVIATSENLETAAGHTTRAVADVNLCSLPGGTNAPGTVVRVVAEQVGHPQTTMHTEFTLEDSGGMQIEMTGSPHVGSKVSGGQTIAAGMLIGAVPPAYPLSHIDIYSNTDPTPRRIEMGAQPVCAENTALRVFAKEFRVPTNPPPFYTVTATLYDTHGKSATATASWPTGNEWTGSIRLNGMVTDGCTETVVQNQTLDLVVGAKGTVRGTETGTYEADFTACGGPETSNPIDYPVSGQLTKSQFDLTLYMGAYFTDNFGESLVIPLTSPNTAAAQFHRPWAGTGTVAGIVNLKCTTC